MRRARPYLPAHIRRPHHYLPQRARERSRPVPRPRTLRGQARSRRANFARRLWGEKSTACGGRRPPPHCFFSNKRFLQAKRLLKGTRGHMRPLQGSAPAGGASFILPPSAPDQVKTNRFAEADSAAARFPFAAISIAQIAGFARFWQLPHKNGKICTLRRGEEELQGVVQGEMPRLHVVVHHGEHVERAVFAP